MLNNGQVSKKAAFGSETLIRGWGGAFVRADAYKCSKVEDAQHN